MLRGLVDIGLARRVLLHLPSREEKMKIDDGPWTWADSVFSRCGRYRYYLAGEAV